MQTRREFFEAAGVAAFSAAAPLSGSDAPWFDRPMRWAQLNLTEDDPANMDIGFWLDYFKRIHAEGVCLTAGGVVAFYPSRIPLHHHSQWLPGHESFLADMIAGCRKLNMTVLLRTLPTRMCSRPTPTGLPWMQKETSAATGKSRRCGSPARLVLIISSS